ncbi:hypothetical protein HPB50_000379 [Hyalomma asiaticum]|uniref:Uncharacterized protein n=1 Tax=Hyalomma asiaticum TaxID=266040 RepID=A0ACB7SCJ5_HYAAI|nr:hypothetical protein HPB50_000379 [Hyalomma asiaticum]
MIISKDLFILGDEYLTMPRQDKYTVCSNRRLDRVIKMLSDWRRTNIPPSIAFLFRSYIFLPRDL